MPHPAPKPTEAKPKRERGRPVGTGREDPRTRTLPRVSEAVYTLLSDYATKHGLFLADAVEEAAASLHLRTEVKTCLRENAHLADGDQCTLIRLKRALKARRPEKRP